MTLTYVVGLAGLTHVVAGSVEVLFLVMSGTRSWLSVAAGYMLMSSDREHPGRSHEYLVAYVPEDMDTQHFGGNSNWRGPIWRPITSEVSGGRLPWHLPNRSEPERSQKSFGNKGLGFGSVLEVSSCLEVWSSLSANGDLRFPFAFIST